MGNRVPTQKTCSAAVVVAQMCFSASEMWTRVIFKVRYERKDRGEEDFERKILKEGEFMERQ